MIGIKSGAKSQYSLEHRTWKEKLLSEKWLMFYLAIPLVGLLLVFSYMPLLGWIYAFFDYRPGVPLSKTPFAGLKYFLMPFTQAKESAQIVMVLKNTFAISFLGLLVTPLPMIFAIFLNEIRNKPFKKITQTITTLPNFISWVLVYSIFYASFSVEDGFVNQILLKVGLLTQPINPLANGDIAWYFQTGVGLWKNLGWSGIIYLASISTIDVELYDAAMIDGAGRFQRIWNITVPGLLPTFFILVVLHIAGFLNNGFEQFYVFDNAMVREKLKVLDMYVYREGIGANHYSYATAIGILKSAVSMILLFSINGFSKLVRGTTVF